jgi:sterol desaturase/sphingolipid hydroxylase (fatty acid hydroxylase superfamily)
LSTVETPASLRWAEEARKGRRRLYPVTAVYTGLCLAALVLGLRSSRPATAMAMFVLGLAFWTWVEYLIHRYILHGRFPDGPGFQRVTHRLFDHLHIEHHKRPWDGSHINGTLKDSAWFVLPLFLVSLLLPAWALTSFFAGVIQAGIVEEWVHHSVHFYHFDNLYFRYIKRHHMYHHSPKGDNEGFGLTNGFWDMVYGTRIPAPVRVALYGSLRSGGSSRARHTA